MSAYLDTTVDVTNRSNGTVLYSIPERHIMREFNRQETKKIPIEEMVELSSQPGGRELIYNYFYIQDEQILHDILSFDEEIEYWLTESQIPDWLMKCPEAELEDALNYAPEGVIDLIKKNAVEIPIMDMSKRNIIKKLTGLDVTLAIQHNEEAKEDQPEIIKDTGRRSTTTTIQKPSSLEKTGKSKYKDVKILS